jgi:hypothetical protein
MHLPFLFLAQKGFDLGDWLIPLLLVGGAIANLISQRKAKTGAPPPRPAAEEPPPWVVEEAPPPAAAPAAPSAQDFDELMEALGMKEARKPKPPPAVIQPRVFSPPTPAPSPVREALDIPKEHPSMGDRTSWPEQAGKFVSRVAPPAPSIKPPSATPPAQPAARPKLSTQASHVPYRRNALRRLLREPATLRQAILLNELLGPPTAYRP